MDFSPAALEYSRLERVIEEKFTGEKMPAAQLATLVETHLAGILAHRRWGLTNGFMEGLNSVFNATKRKTRGYRLTNELIIMLYLIAGKLRLPRC